MDEQSYQAGEVAPNETSYARDNIFHCPLCKKWKNQNRMRKVMGWHTWKSMSVCVQCFKESGLEC